MYLRTRNLQKMSRTITFVLETTPHGFAKCCATKKQLKVEKREDLENITFIIQASFKEDYRSTLDKKKDRETNVIKILGSLSNDDGNGHDNAAKQ